jgi:hypothetical protein
VSYVLRPGRISGAGRGRGELEATIVLVGCGGTGGFFAEALGRLLLGQRAALFLVDPDRVERTNVSRQAFDAADVGRFKSEVLAERLSRRFGGQVSYSVLPYETRLHDVAFGEPSRLALVVGAVDNAAARRAIATTLEERVPYPARKNRPAPILWLDAGNARNSGQVLLGNALHPDQLHGAFNSADEACFALPAPSLQRPDLLASPPEPVLRPRRDCAVAVAEGDQGKTINQMMAALLAAYVERLVDGTCRWMATYFDLDDGFLRFVPAEPHQVASVVGLHPNALLRRAGGRDRTPLES